MTAGRVLAPAAGFEWLLALPDRERGDSRVPPWDLGRVRRVVARLGNPQDRYPAVLVAGSKGKGSTAAMLAAILGAEGARVGLYTQPHLHAYGERIRVGDECITPAEAAEGLAAVREAAAEGLTAFEATTALAFLHFARRRVDVAVVEVGLGGRLDATNVVEADLALFCPVEEEHADVLGPGLASIAGHKAGIVKAGCRAAFSSPQHPVVLAVLEDRCRSHGVPLEVLAPAEGLPMALRGFFQRQNAALAVAAARALGAGSRAVAEGLRHVRWPGRLEVVAARPLTVVDGAHTPGSARALARALREEFRFRRLGLVLGAARDKDLAGMAAALGPGAARVFAARANHPRARPPGEVAAAVAPYADAEVAGSVAEALARAWAWAGPEDLVCATGSLRVAAEVREACGLA